MIYCSHVLEHVADETVTDRLVTFGAYEEIVTDRLARLGYPTDAVTNLGERTVTFIPNKPSISSKRFTV